MINTLSKINLSKIGWEGGREVNLNLDNVFEYTVFFGDYPLVFLKGIKSVPILKDLFSHLLSETVNVSTYTCTSPNVEKMLMFMT